MLGRHVLQTLAGQVAPSLAAVVAFPVLLAGLGAGGLGILHVTWTVVGYFSLLDMGLGRALTQVVAAALARGRHDEIGPLVYTGCVILAAIGTAGAVIFGVSATWIADAVLGTNSVGRADAILAFRLVALAVPLITLAAGARGVLEAQQRFDLVNRVRIPTGILLYAAPAIATPFTSSVAVASGLAVAVRGGAAVALLALIYRHAPVAAGTWRWSPGAFRTLFSSGMWMAAANAIGTATQFADRVALSVFASVSAVAYYATPLDIVSRVGVVPTSIATVTFPVFSAHHVAGPASTAPLAVKSGAYILLAVFPPLLAAAALAPELLSWWMGPDFARQSLTATRLITIGSLANALAQVPFAVLQATGRARATAQLAALEFPVYALALWAAAEAWGVEGVALAWSARMVIDLAAHAAVANPAFAGHGQQVRGLIGATAVSFGGLAGTAAFSSVTGRLAVVTLAVGCFGFALARVLPPNEITAMLRSALRKGR